MLVRDVLVIGAGPAGLATAIAARRAGLSYSVVEKGLLVNTLFHYPANMVFFTTPNLLELGGLPFITPYAKPTREEALKYYRRVVETFELEIAFEEEVLRVTPETGPSGERMFTVDTRSARGVRRALRARFVVLATGAFDAPNLVGVPGEDLPHVSHYFREVHPYYRRRVVVVGGENSAADAALELCRNGAFVTLVHRHAALGSSIKYWVRPDIENRIKEGTVAARFETRVVEIRPTEVVVERHGERDTLEADAVLLMTGYHADEGLLDRTGVAYEPRTFTPRFDSRTFESNVEGIFLAGAVQMGRDSGQIFIENGRFHGEQVVRTIAARLGVGEAVAPGLA